MTEITRSVEIGQRQSALEQDMPCSVPHQREEWRIYWQARKQPWRTEPEIDLRRQQELAGRQALATDIAQGIYPFKEYILSRADIEWLLATHEDGRGPVEWQDEKQKRREGLDVRGAYLSTPAGQLAGLPLARLRGGLQRGEWHSRKEADDVLMQAAVHLEKADLFGAQLQGAQLCHAYLQDADLRLAQLQATDLRRARLEHANLTGAQLQDANLDHACMQEVYLTGVQAEGANLHQAQLQNATLFGTNLEKAYLVGASLEGANLTGAQMQGADLREACLVDTDLTGAQMQGVNLAGITWSNRKRVGPLLAGVQWGDTNLTSVDWSRIEMVGEEYRAWQRQDSQKKRKPLETRIQEHTVAIQTNRQLALVLRSQGLYEEADHFMYRARVLAMNLLRLRLQVPQTIGSFVGTGGAYLLACFAYLIAGYGYKLTRCVIAYLLVTGGFTLGYVLSGSQPLGVEAFLYSLTAFHGRGFFPPDWQHPGYLWDALEALAGLLIIMSFLATLIRRFVKD